MILYPKPLLACARRPSRGRRDTRSVLNFDSNNSNHNNGIKQLSINLQSDNMDVIASACDQKRRPRLELRSGPAECAKQLNPPPAACQWSRACRTSARLTPSESPPAPHKPPGRPQTVPIWSIHCPFLPVTDASKNRSKHRTQNISNKGSDMDPK